MNESESTDLKIILTALLDLLAELRDLAARLTDLAYTSERT